MPLIGCGCAVCTSKDPKNQRTRASVWFETDGASFLIDTSTDFRAQALRERISRIDAVLFSHPHSDHISGIDDLRAFNFLQNQSIPVYGHSWTETELKQRYAYIFSPTPSEGGGIPRLDFHRIDAKSHPVNIAGIPIGLLSVAHGRQETLGFRINDVAYVTDCHYIPAETRERMRGLEVLILDCVRIAPHPTHLNVDGALEVVRDLKPKRTFLTHLGHEFDYSDWNRKLPDGIELAYDGLRIEA